MTTDSPSVALICSLSYCTFLSDPFLLDWLLLGSNLQIRNLTKPKEHEGFCSSLIEWFVSQVTPFVINLPVLLDSLRKKWRRSPPSFRIGSFVLKMFGSKFLLTFLQLSQKSQGNYLQHYNAADFCSYWAYQAFLLLLFIVLHDARLVLIVGKNPSWW